LISDGCLCGNAKRLAPGVGDLAHIVIATRLSHTAEAEDKLRQALAIFQRIGAAEAADVRAELDAAPGTPDPAPASP
jgi:hypothetical protein